MTSTRRSLTVLGVLLAVLAASAGVAQAQTPPVPAAPSMTPNGYGAFTVTITDVSGTLATDTYDIRYEEETVSVDTAMNAGSRAFTGEGDVIMSIGTARSYTVRGLKHNTPYKVALRAVRGSGASAERSAWSDSDTSTSEVQEGRIIRTIVAPDMGKVSGLKVEARNAGAMATWTAIADPTGFPVFRYEWRATNTAVGTSNGYVEGDMTEAMIMGLTNGVEYTVTVRAWASLNGELDSGRSGAWSDGMRVTPMADAGDGDGDDDEEEPMPTPAVPLAGVLALFAGLLAAARARLRRR